MRQNYDHTSAYFRLPRLETRTPHGAPELALQAEGEDFTGGRGLHALPAFDDYLRQTRRIEVYNRGGGELEWKARVSDRWIRLDKSHGKTATEETVGVSIDWQRAPKDANAVGKIEFRAGGSRCEVLVPLFRPAAPARDELKGLFVESNGVVSIPAAQYHRKQENDAVRIRRVEDLGIEGAALQLGDATAPLQNYRDPQTPAAAYDFYAFDAGSVPWPRRRPPTSSIRRSGTKACCATASSTNRRCTSTNRGATRSACGRAIRASSSRRSCSISAA